MFLTIEGIEGCGKSTLARSLVDRLRSDGLDVVETREPGGTPFGDRLRAIFLEPGTQMGPLSEAFLMNASRATLVGEVILPSLKSGKTVVCDRFFDATVAYQGFGRGLDVEAMLGLSKTATAGLEPDVTLLLDLPVPQALERVARRTTERGLDRMEREPIAFHERVRAGYLALARRFARIAVIDARESPERVLAESLRAIVEVRSAP